MRATPIHDALQLVQQLRVGLLDKQRFRGFSGPVRALSGTVALVSAWVMRQPWYPAETKFYLLGWAFVFLVALVLNFGGGTLLVFQ